MATRKAMDKAFEKLELQRRRLVERLGNLPAEDLSATPASGGWSVAQIIAHMAIIEEGSLAYLRKKYAGGGHSPARVSSIARLLLLKAALASPFKFKAPAVVADVPATSCSEAITRWATARSHLGTACAEVRDEHLGHELFRHPLLGHFDLVQALDFIYAHHQRHLGQIDRILRSSL